VRRLEQTRKERWTQLADIMNEEVAVRSKDGKSEDMWLCYTSHNAHNVDERVYE